MSEAIKTVSRADIDAMLRHIVRCPGVMQRAVSKLQLEDFDPATEKSHKLIYAIASDFYKKYMRLPPIDLLYTEIQSRTQNHPDFDPETLQSTLNLTHHLFVVPADDQQLVPSWALDVMHSFLYQRRVHSRMVQHIEQFGTQGEDILEELALARTSAAIHIGSTVEPFSEDATPQSTSPRDPTNVQFVDVMLGGGTRGGEVYGFIAPSGGGKTTFSHQLGISGATDEKHVFIFSYEESPRTSEYMVPVYSSATGFKRKVFDRERPWEAMTAEQQKKFVEVKKSIGVYLHYVDMSGAFDNAGRGGAHEIHAYLSEQANNGIKPHGVIIDWLWPMFSRYFADFKVDRNKMLQERGLAQQIMDDLKQVASKLNCYIWVNHQSSPASTDKKGPASWTDAAEFKSFAWLVSVCFSLGVLDEQQITQFNCSKNRNNKNSTVTLQLHGDVCVFKPKSGDYNWSARKQGYVKEGEEGRVPGAVEVPGTPDPSADSVRQRGNYEGHQVDF